MAENYILRRIREVRMSKKLSQKEVAKLLGISQPAYSAKEKYPHRITLEDIEKIAKILDVPFALLTNETVNWEEVSKYIDQLNIEKQQRIYNQNYEIRNLNMKLDKIRNEHRIDLAEKREDYRSLHNEYYKYKEENRERISRMEQEDFHKEKRIRKLLDSYNQISSILTGLQNTLTVENIIAQLPNDQRDDVDINNLFKFLSTINNVLNEADEKLEEKLTSLNS